MKITPSPANESERLAALRSYHILDTPPEIAFDSITKLASFLCDTPISLVTLVDADRLWFKSSSGIEITELPRDGSFCAHGILQDDIMIILDTLEDKRFYDSPLVCGSPNIRFYAGAPLKNADGYPLGTLCVIDIKPRQLTKEQLHAFQLLANQVIYLMERRKAERELKLAYAAVNKSKSAYFRITPAGKVVYANDSACQSLGYTSDELVSLSIWDFDPLYFPETVSDRWEKIKQNGIQTCESIHRRKDGVIFPVEVTTNYILSNGEEYRFCFVQDITERKQNQASLQALLGMNSRIISNSTQGIMLFNSNGQCVLVNEAAIRISGAPSLSAQLERNFHNIPVWKESGLFDLGMQALETNTPRKGEYHHVSSFGRDVWLIVDLIPYRVDEQQFLLVLMTDVHEFRQTEQELREAKLLAEAASRAKGNFLANMSHEIRTPMNAIIGMTQLVLETSLDATQRDYILEANNAAKSLLGILNDILDFSKIEAGKLTFEKVPFYLDKLLYALQSVVGLAAQEKGLELEFILDKDAPTGLVGDPLRLRQVLTNLISNAVKFTQQGKITVRVSLLKQEQDNHRVCLYFEIRDTGIGISNAQQAHLFEAFSQGDSSITRRFGGTGLGLAVSKKLVEIMDGEIGVESEADKGSCFHFSAWFGLMQKSVSVADTRQPMAAEDYRLQGMRALLVEDVDINRRMASIILKKAGVLIVEACDGEEALARLESSPDSFDIVLMDVQMPVMDGLMATRLIRQNPRFGKLPVIAMTAFAMKEDEMRCYEVGMNDYVSKPINPADLYSTLAKYKH